MYINAIKNGVIFKMEILKTKKYEIFKIIDGNRDIDFSHVRKLIASIQKQNLLAVNPIIVDNKFNVIDGQHRLTACIELKIDIFYIILDNPNLNQNIIDLQISKNWVFEDYLKHYLKLGIFEYKVVNEIIKKYNIGMSNTVRLIGTGRAPTKDFKMGTFKLKTEMKQLYLFLDKLMDFQQFNPNYIKKTQFIQSFLIIFSHPLYDHKHMIKNFELLQDRFYIKLSVVETTNELEKIYNYNKINKIRFY